MRVGGRTRSLSVTGALWSAGGTATLALGQFVVLAVLARVLVPADFGVVTASLVLVGLARLATSEGVVGPALTQRKDMTEQHVHAAFLLSLGTGFFAAAVSCLLAPAVAAFFEMPPLVDVTRALAVTLVVQSFATVPPRLSNTPLSAGQGLARVVRSGCSPGQVGSWATRVRPGPATTVR